MLTGSDHSRPTYPETPASREADLRSGHEEDARGERSRKLGIVPPFDVWPFEVLAWIIDIARIVFVHRRVGYRRSIERKVIRRRHARLAIELCVHIDA